jgi:hypothetical protein
MDFSPKDLVSLDEVVSSLSSRLGDRSFKIMSKGFYKQIVQDALRELAFESFFDKRHEALPYPENNVLELPAGVFNIKEVYLFNGNECNIQTARRVYFKKDMIVSGAGYFAKHTGNPNMNDPFYKERTSGLGTQPICSMQNGMLMFAYSGGYENILLVYNGTGGDLFKVPFIPEYLKQAIIVWSSFNLAEVYMANDKENFQLYRTIAASNEKKIYDLSGPWEEAKRRVKRANDKERQDFKEYMSRMNY